MSKLVLINNYNLLEKRCSCPSDDRRMKETPLVIFFFSLFYISYVNLIP
jgi:hypothetical protein